MGRPVPTLAAVQAQLALLANRLYDAVMLMDESFRILYANPMALRISQITEENFNRETLWELYPGVLESRLGQAYLEAVATREEREVHGFYYDPLKTTFDLRIFPMDGGVGVHYRDVTALRKAEAERDALSMRLHQVLAATTDGVVSLDRDFRIVYINPKAAALLAPSGDIMGRLVFEAFPHAVYENSPYVSIYNRALLDREPGAFEAFYPEPLNTWFHIMAHPSEEGIILFFRDITLQKQREEALRDSETRYRVLTELSPHAQWTATPEGLVLYANQRFLDYVGHDFIPKTGMEYLRLIDERDRERVLEVWSHSVATGEDFDIDTRLLRAADGESRWWHLRALPVRDEAGAIQQWIGSALDIHEERLAAERLHHQFAENERQRRELEAIYHGSPIGMALYEPKDLRLLRINDREAQILDITAEEAIGKTLQQLTHGIPRVHDLMRRAANGEAMLNQHIEGFLPSRPDEYRYWNINYSPIFAEDGSVHAVASATVEITHQKRAEAALIQSEKLAAVGRMASSIAHEINNPLESVMNLIYIARQAASGPEVQTFLDLADQELRRVSIIANQTLRFHKQSTKPRAVLWDDLLESVLSIYQGRLSNSGIKVQKRFRATRPMICFEGEIRQVLNNLIGNAIDAMPEGGRLILRSHEGHHPHTGQPGSVLTVADTGSGIDPQTQSRIFEAFFTTKGLQGTGLGLWISSEILLRHEGHIAIRSSQDKAHRGTIFSLFLPFEGVSNRDPALATPSVPTLSTVKNN